MGPKEIVALKLTQSLIAVKPQLLFSEDMEIIDQHIDGAIRIFLRASEKIDDQIDDSFFE
jgi:hypothetical protein